jgi:cobalt-zinc-cadmium efflux system protein
MEGISNVHDLHYWSMDGEYNILSVHIIVNSQLNMEEIIKLKLEIKSELKELNIQHSTIEIEQEKESCEFIDNCC